MRGPPQTKTQERTKTTPSFSGFVCKKSADSFRRKVEGHDAITATMAALL